MDNAPIHQSKDIEFAIKQLWSVATVAYTSPPYSPELNPIEQLCPKVKYAVKMNLLVEWKTLSPIAEACYLVTHEDLRGYAAYSASRFLDCFNRNQI
ncbi:hypothetical protein [Absidia glauca]|uniref:Tc1-like transposase DDE domain-containing protein n=1 Tax=Absidia glauca TaxID=4829 RepID=A0A163KBH7_ABSGL|nr:hypothetical protein [Absidia glauca]